LAWVSLDPRDNDETAFWSLVRESLRTAGLLASTAEARAGTVVEETMRDLDVLASGDADPLHLVLDDVHVLTDPDVIASLDLVLRHPVPGLRIIMASRSDPLLPLHRYRIRGELSELRASDVAMTSAEIDCLLAAHHVTIDERHKALLAARTEGWVAGLRLSAMRMEASDEPARFVTDFALDRGSIGEFLMEEVLAALDAPARRLLIRTSSCQAVCGSLADAICKTSGSANVLHELAASNSFVTRVIPESDWFRFHPLLREVLQYLLRGKSEEFQHGVESRAAQWHEEHGDLVQALGHALQGQAWSRCAGLLAAGAFEQLFIRTTQAPPGDLEPFLRARPRDGSAEQQHVLLTAQAAVAAATGRPDAASYLTDLPVSQVVVGPSGLLLGYALVSRAAVLGDQPALQSGTADLLDRDPTGPFGAWALLHQGRLELWSGDDVAADQQLTEALGLAASLALHGLTLENQGLLAILHCSVGRLSLAEKWLHRSRTLLNALPRLSGTLFAAAHHLASAEVALARGHDDAYERAIRLVSSTVAPTRDPALGCATSLIKAKALQVAGHYESARDVIQSDPSCQAPGAWGLPAVASMMLLELESQAGSPRTALERLDEGRPAHPHVARMSEVARARAHLAIGDLDRAEGLVRRVLTTSGPAAPLTVLLEAVLLGSEIAAKKGDDLSALDGLARAIELGSGQQVQFPFVQISPRLRGLLSTHPALAERWPGGVDTAEPPSARAALPKDRLAGRLTDREISVLRWLTTTMSTAEIADELCVSTNTVKTHLAAIYRKLGSSRRRDAVDRGRELHLI
jgi:LuxR family maltose regulon positive regulatory protein